MNDTPVTDTEGDRTESSRSGTYRLIIRAPILPDAPAESRSDARKKSRVPALLVAAVAAALAVWVVAITLEQDAPANTGSRETFASSRAIPGSEDSIATDQVSPTRESESRVADFAPASEPEAVAAASASELETMPVNAVTPTAARSALDTIRGTIRVSVRVTIDPRGAVAEATTVDAGPSRYFERLALDAARQWTFTPTNTDAPRTELLHFHFTREGATARADEN